MVKNRLTLAFLLLWIMPCFAHSVVEEGGNYRITHEWKYGGRQWSSIWYVPVSLYEYYQGRAHVSDDMVHFVLSDYDRSCVQSLVESFRKGGEEVGYSDRDNLNNVITFVQSLQYVFDEDSKGEEDYVRFPLETLVDGVGDCEDMAILAAAILYEMGYDVLLVSLPDHLALAVNCQWECNGTYYLYEGVNYYYLEVTNTGWDIGEIPNEYRSCQAKLMPLINKPKVRVKRCSYQYDAYYSTAESVPFVVYCELENVGPGMTEQLSLRVLFKWSEMDDAAFVDRTFALEDLEEGNSLEYEARILVPRPFRGVIEIRAEGLNFGTDAMQLKGVDLK